MKDKLNEGNRRLMRGSHEEDALGSNSDIGAKLRALYNAVQDEAIPDKFLSLLEQLDNAEQVAASQEPAVAGRQSGAQ